jgi:hypothetical protein
MNLRNSITIGLALMMIILVTFFCIRWFDNDSKSKISASLLEGSSNRGDQEIVALKMLAGPMLTDQGLVVAEIQKGKPANYYLLESMGLLLQYAVLCDKPDTVKQILTVIDKCFYTSEKFYAWRIKQADFTHEQATALVDDLRLIEGLSQAQTRGLGNYNRYFGRISDSIYRYETVDGHFVDYYDARMKEPAHRLSLFYINISALEALAASDERWEKPNQSARLLLRKSPVNSEGFFPAWYDYQTQEYNYPQQINMVENLYSGINYALVGGNPQAFADFLNSELDQGAIFTRYYLDGTPASHDQSAAVYALAARFLDNIGQREDAALSRQIMLSFQINKYGILLGAFGDLNSRTVHSFDQLECLITLRRGE